MEAAFFGSSRTGKNSAVAPFLRAKVRILANSATRFIIPPGRYTSKFPASRAPADKQPVAPGAPIRYSSGISMSNQAFSQVGRVGIAHQLPEGQKVSNTSPSRRNPRRRERRNIGSPAFRIVGGQCPPYALFRKIDGATCRKPKFPKKPN